jgi:hypothetical protein
MTHTKTVTVTVRVEAEDLQQDITLDVPFPTSFSDLEILVRQKLEATVPNFTFETPAQLELISVS